MKRTSKKTRQGFFICSVLASVVLLLSTVVSVLADSDADDAANFGMRAKRITSLCTAGSPGIAGIPEVPPPASVADPNCPTVPTVATSPNGRWSYDISWFDPGTQKYYLADRNNFGIDIVDTRTDKVVGQATGFVGNLPGSNTSGPNGVVVTNSPHQLWAGDGDGDIRVWNLDKDGFPTSSVPLKVIAHGDVGFWGANQLPTHRADELAYDPDHHMILQAWDDDSDLFVALISVSSNANNIKLVKQFSFKPEAVGCGIEQPVYDHGLGKFFVAIPCTTTHTNGELAVIDPVAKTKSNGITLDGTGCFPHGLALGPRQNFIVGCSADGPAGTKLNSLIVKATTGDILLTITQVGGNDEVWYNPGDNNYYLAGSNNTSSCVPPLPPGTVGGCKGGTAAPVLGIVDAGTADHGPEAPEWIQNIPTVSGAHSVAAVFAVRCERDDGHHKDKDCDHDDRDRDDAVRNRVYVPLTTVPSSGPPFTEPGGIGVYGRIP